MDMGVHLYKKIRSSGKSHCSCFLYLYRQNTPAPIDAKRGARFFQKKDTRSHQSFPPQGKRSRRLPFEPVAFFELTL